ncbi:hypothetical protein GALL_258520 [mine drainage metagenome]|uniref:Uncharacterized protein n=1 Tax=mine drainage metagenome TaxID=410659 RepID=A0A1J5RJL8_9ZZZZ
MAPAQQRLDADDGAAVQGNLRLIIELQFVELQGMAQLGLERQPLS